jgi:NADH-quinone oxidoreductase subunit M
VPLIALTLFGIYPVPIMDVTAASVDALINNSRLPAANARAPALSVNLASYRFNCGIS